MPVRRRRTIRANYRRRRINPLINPVVRAERQSWSVADEPQMSAIRIRARWRGQRPKIFSPPSRLASDCRGHGRAARRVRRLAGPALALRRPSAGREPVVRAVRVLSSAGGRPSRVALPPAFGAACRLEPAGPGGERLPGRAHHLDDLRACRPAAVPFGGRRFLAVCLPADTRRAAALPRPAPRPAGDDPHDGRHGARRPRRRARSSSTWCSAPGSSRAVPSSRRCSRSPIRSAT